jgi:hypothetical protein
MGLEIGRRLKFLNTSGLHYVGDVASICFWQINMKSVLGREASSTSELIPEIFLGIGYLGAIENFFWYQFTKAQWSY